MLFTSILNSLNYLVDDITQIKSITNEDLVVTIYTKEYTSVYVLKFGTNLVTNTIMYKGKFSTEIYTFSIQDDNILIEN